VNIRELAKHDDFICRYTHKTKGGVYTVVTKALAAGEIGDVFGSVVVYRNEHGDVFVRSLKFFNDNMNLID
jgi:hypothetical protein